MTWGTLFSQNKLAKDTLKIKDSDRNVMLNASNNTDPQKVNVGLPASVGGTTIFENDLPVVYHFWPEMPTKAWRKDASVNRQELLDLSQTALYTGTIGFSVSTFDNLGTDQFQGNGSLNSNHFGLIRGDMNLSGPISKNGLKYTVGAYLSLDPGTFKAKGYPKYYLDKAQFYKAGLTKDYKTSNGKGSITVFYKYANVEGLPYSYAPYYYDKGGKVREIDGFKIGNDSYYENSGKVVLMDAYTGQYKTQDITSDFRSESHVMSLFWKHTFNNGINLKFNTKYKTSKTGLYQPAMTGVSSADSKYTYLDGTPYTGEYVQNVMSLATRRTPIKTFLSTIELSKKSKKHYWRIGLNEWNYNADKYTTEANSYVQEVAENPSILIPVGANPDNYKNGMTGFNSSMEYHDGSQNKLALFLMDKWDISDALTLNLGTRLEYQSLRGNYIKKEDRVNGLLTGPKSKIKNDWLNKTFSVSGVYKITDKFGVLGDVMYTEQGGHLGNYNVGVDPHIKQSKIPEFGAGVFYNHKYFSLVSKATYISRNNYSANTNFTHPISGLVSRTVVGYDIETIGWTTDVVAKPFSGFNLHFLITLQSPKYTKYGGTLNFSDGTTRDFDFEGKSVTSISKVLLEIDPSYTYKNLRVWASARYFSKQYANLSNTLTFEGRWETFAGANYKINKYLDFNVNVVNLLNQRGASGTISGTDLMTDEEAKTKEGTVMSGTYIRPFTVEFGMKVKF